MIPVRIDVEVGSQAWLDARLPGIGASEIPVILGLAPWGSPFDLFHSKLGHVDGEHDNEAMQMGRDLESVILKRFAREHPELDVLVGALYQHGERAWQLATPDALAYDPENLPSGRTPHVWPTPIAVVQAKAAARWEHWGEEGTDEIPVHYRAQVMHEMDVLGVELAHIPVLVPPFSYREYVVHYDAEEAAFMRKHAEEFLDRLQRNDPPDIDDRPATTRTLKALHPEAGEGGVEIPATWWRQWKVADRLEKAAAARKTLAENRIRARLGDAQHAYVDGEPTPVGGRTVFNRTAVDAKALRIGHPAVWEQCKRTSTVHQLRIRRDKEPNHGR